MSTDKKIQMSTDKRGFTPLEMDKSLTKDIRPDVSSGLSLTGFTLTELIITIIIFSIMMAAILGMLTLGRNTFSSGSVQIETQQESRRALEYMSKELLQTRTTLIQGVPADSNNYTSITFKIPEDTDVDNDTLNDDGSIEWSGDIQYSLNNESQIIRTYTSDTKVLANRIIVLKFRRLSTAPNIIQMYVNASKTTLQGHSIYCNLTSWVKFRN